MRPLAERWARLGPSKPPWMIHTPIAGVCLSAFLIVRDPRGRILLGLPRAHSAWATKGGLPVRHARGLEDRGEWLLPARHLRMEESPEDAAQSIARDWIGMGSARPHLLMVQSHLRPSAAWKGQLRHRIGRNHWDLCFVFVARTTRQPTPRPWWSELRFVPRGELARTRMGRGHRDILRRALALPFQV
jgi:hypothetical protein